MTSLTSLLEKHPTCVLGHRGARGEQLENSRAGFIHTQNLSQHFRDKLVGIEFDVQLTHDGKLVVFHDDTLLRLLSRQSRVDQCTAHEIQSISQSAMSMDSRQNNQNILPPVMLLEEMPLVLEGYSHIELEIKTHNRTPYPKLIESLKQSLAKPEFAQLPLTLTSFDLQLHHHLQADPKLSRFKRGLLVEPVSPQVLTELTLYGRNFSYQNNNTGQKTNRNSRLYKDTLMSTGSPLAQTVETALRLQCQALGLYYPLFDESIISECHKYGLSTTAWTVNNIDYAKYLTQLGVNYLITDYPSHFIQS